MVSLLCTRLGVSPGLTRERDALEIEAEVLLRLQALGVTARGFSVDLTVARCLYMLCRALTPRRVLETGVAYGASSAFILQALETNGLGRLESIDTAPVDSSIGQTEVGGLVPERLRASWRLHEGTSRRLLPKLLREGEIDVFVHDSLHTYRNMKREFRAAWAVLRKGGVVVADDVQLNAAFQELQQSTRSRGLVARQQEKQSALFGVLVKE
jgi:predicted O-methyltransferase YrrM